MTFWQENYGFVKDVYDFRLQKYQEWMDNLEGIVNKVLSPGVQYTYKEFKIIQDSLTVSMSVVVEKYRIITFQITHPLGFIIVQ